MGRPPQIVAMTQIMGAPDREQGQGRDDAFAPVFPPDGNPELNTAGP